MAEMVFGSMFILFGLVIMGIMISDVIETRRDHRRTIERFRRSAEELEARMDNGKREREEIQSTIRTIVKSQRWEIKK
jgi:hypothetical protein